MNRKKLNSLFMTEEKIDPKTGKKRVTSRYCGPLYRLAPEPLKNAKYRMTAAVVGVTALFVVAGLIMTAAARCLYVLPFYAFMLLTIYFSICGCISLWRLPQPFDEIRREEAVQRSQTAMLAQTLLAAMWFVGDVLFLLIDREPHIFPNEWIFMACAAASAFLSYHAWRVLNSLKPETTCDDRGSEGDKDHET